MAGALWLIFGFSQILGNHGFSGINIAYVLIQDIGNLPPFQISGFGLIGSVFSTKMIDNNLERR